jgi:hypothetical protein
MANAFQPHAFQGDGFQIVVTDTWDQSQLTGTQFVSINGGTSATSAEVGQSFVPTASTVTAVQLEVYKSGCPSDNLLIEIQTDASNLPSGTVVGSTISIASASLTTLPGLWTEFAVNAPVTSGVKHWIVARRDIGGAGDSTNSPRWRASVASSYAGGGYSPRNGTTGVWTAESATIDMKFVTWSPVAGPSAELPILVMAPPG